MYIYIYIYIQSFGLLSGGPPLKTRACGPLSPPAGSLWTPLKKCMVFIDPPFGTYVFKGPPKYGTYVV